MTAMQTLKTSFNQVAKWRPTNRAFTQAKGDRSVDYTYSEANAEARQLANAIANCGVEKGDRIAILSRTTVEHALTFFSIQKIGAIACTLHNREAANTIIEMVRDISPRLLFFQPEFTDLVQSIHDNDTPVDTLVCYDTHGPAPDFARPYSQFVAGGALEEPTTTVSPDDISFINFSSGTTGQPKGIVHSHASAVEAAHMGQYIFGFRPTDVFLETRTPSFIGWMDMVLPAVNRGAELVFLEHWNPAAVPTAIEEHGVSQLLLVPTQYKAVLQENVGDYDLGSVRLASYSGESMPPELFKKVKATISENVTTAYGTTETMTSATALSPNEVTESTLGSIGRPIPNVDLRVIEPGSYDSTQEVDDGNVGELILRGPSLADGVWEDPEKTEEIFDEDGWFFSGDLGYIDDDRNIYLQGRRDNMIISGGINIYPERIEAILESHPSIVECAVVGVPDSEWGEVPKAVIVATDSGLTEMDLEDWCKRNDDLADYQRPRHWEFKESLPQTNTGKVDRNALRDR